MSSDRSPRGGAPAPVFEVAGLSFTYLERFPALDDVTFAVHEGEKLALLGANGCGKSTLLKILDGLLFGQAGTLHAYGQVVTEEALEDEQFAQAFRSRIGFVFQNPDVQLFSPTVREEVAFGPLQMGLDSAEAEARTEDVLALLGIAALADRAPFQLSGGQKKRVAIASVLVMNPEVVLFDEPTAALDPRTRHWLLELIEELNGAGKTIVHATHDLEVLGRIADRCLVLGEDHRVVAEGSPAEIMDDVSMLTEANLVHEHLHFHGGALHEHAHTPEHHGEAEHPRHAATSVARRG